MNVDTILRRGQVTFVVLLGVAAAIPGMKALQQLRLPSEVQDLFPFVLAAFSAAAVLSVYLLRDTFAKWSAWKVVVTAAMGLVVMLLFFLLFIMLLNRVWVAHAWRQEPSRTFVPLFLGDSAQRLIAGAGSRSQALTKYGADYLTPFATETNLSLTLSSLLLCYTMIVVSLAVVFSVLYVRASVQASGAGKQ